MKKLFWLVPVALAAAGWWAYHRSSDAPQIPFAKVVRETLVSTLPTNGKVEPIEWQAVRVEQAALVSKVPVQPGQAVSEGQALAILSDTGLQADLDAATARVAQAKADLAVIDQGGKQLELNAIDTDLARLRVEKDHDEKEYASLRRLADKQAASMVEVDEIKAKLQAAEMAIDGLEKKRGALVSQSDKTVAQARLRDAEAAVQLARSHIAQTVIRAPIGGVVYDLAARPGAYLSAGDLVANVGRTDRVRVRVFVDEPELGRVEVGQPVTINWDALPGRAWEGTVERKPSNIVGLGSRQVGEVLCTIDNPGRVLLPGTNVDAHIRTATVDNALTMPKECLRRDASGVGVFVLRGDRLAWQPVTAGASSVTRVQIVQGLAEGDQVALPTEATLRSGQVVMPVRQ
ncbi:MAG TPA: efflux RND transporter periplasmic adaptor subunit [Bryobacteraceae bacterium]|nr:efflux RND transporter periplasmic adaptor subunit [Bryobacteraceae bacterium]